MDTIERQKYRSNFGSTILFSFVQVYQIFIKIVRSKFVAILIGTAGMGITALLHSTTDLISACTNLGLKTSGVKAVASANSLNNREQVSKTITVLRRLILCTGLLGMFICALFAPVWSQTSFGNSDYITSFIIVSLVILFEQLNSGELVLLQGMQQKRSLASANVIGQTLSLLMTVPLYYFFGVRAIVWVLVLSSLMTFIISKCYTSRLKIEKTSVSWKETLAIGWDMIKLGIFLSLQFLLAQAVLYIVRNIVSNSGGVDEVGLYSAGTSIVEVYLGLVFTAIATDYFPRLASSKNNIEMNDAVKRQAEISMLMFAPIVVAFIVFIKPIIILLYSDKFLPIETMMYWAIGATIVKALGWALSYTVLAKAKPLYFFLNELGATCYSLPMKIIGYKIWGLTGFGIAMCLSYSLYLVQMLIVTKKLFGTRIDISVWKIFVFSCLPVVFSLLVKFFCNSNISYIAGSVLLIITAIYAFNELDKRMDLLELIRTKMAKK